jgi:hypothetical protein
MILSAGLLNRQLDYKWIRQLLKSRLLNNTNVLVNIIRELIMKGKPEGLMEYIIKGKFILP